MKASRHKEKVEICSSLFHAAKRRQHTQELLILNILHLLKIAKSVVLLFDKGS